MNRRRIGSLEVSVVGLGGNNFGTDFFGAGCDKHEVDRIVHAALDAGINLFDTAEEYSITSFLGEGHSEELIGAALGQRRDEAIIATKFLNQSEADPDQRGAARIVAAVEASLRRLGTDRIDLYQQHQPDPDTPIEEILEALDRLVRAGKVREVGCSNFTGEMLDDAAETAARSSFSPYRSCQVQYSVLERPQQDVLDAVARHDLAVLAYFPLASGLLTGKYRRGVPPPPDARLGADAMVSTMLRQGIMARRPPLSDERLATVEQLTAFAEERGRSLLELAISWVASQPTVASVLVGVTKPEQIIANASAAGWQLTPDEVAAVDAIVAREA
ncbi:aldo/keto reductase [Pseudofrankia saprophytica]|uniref:aldo/keto reductase n=1 Tax=Pseudofrankia saprophytica TaxID=298655 RepID=UPI000234CA74|nr:aldo/keto reductase [Pseudofrankia saprophytica]